MTPKGAAVLPRPFCCLAAAVLPPFFLFSFPAPLLLVRHDRQLFVNFLPAPMVTLCELLPVPPAGKVYILPTFACAPFWQSLHFANFYPRPVLAKLAFCQLLATLCALAARLLSPSVPISAVFPFFCKLSLYIRGFMNAAEETRKTAPFPF